MSSGARGRPTGMDTTTPATEPRRKAGRREWVGLSVLALACLLYVMDLTVLHLAVPDLSADLQPTGSQLLWIIDVYGFMVAGALVTMGTLGDRIGRRRLLLVGAAAFGAVSVSTPMAAMSWSRAAPSAMLKLPRSGSTSRARAARRGGRCSAPPRSPRTGRSPP